ncbi:MAG: cupin domain-containing protein [Candidatus Velthaea sp.]
MRRIIRLAALPLVFAAGFFCARSMPVVHAAAAPWTAQIVDVGTLTDSDLGTPAPTGSRSKTYAVADGATVAVQSGNVIKHYHADANEIQYILEGSGKFWLGDSVRDVHPGDMIIIPKGTNHAGSQATTGRFKAISIKTPPQAADDVHPVP